jgi:NAD+ kinase
MRLGVVGHQGYDGLGTILDTLVREAPRLGFELSYEAGLLDEGREGAPLAHPSELDALISLGGDGTLLRAARYLDGAAAPIFGVNLGRLGFLTTSSVKEFNKVLPKFAKRQFEVDSRMMLEAAALNTSGAAMVRLRALNDVVLHKGGFARVLRLRFSVNGEALGALAADGLVISTPTGSTAYSLSAGGPIVYPSVDSILVAAVSPRSSCNRKIRRTKFW